MALLATAIPPPTAAGADRPNVLLIVSDDQSVTDPMSVMPRTSEIFAEGGTTYPNGYATTPLCCPSRASIFSGMYAHNHGVTQNAVTAFDADRTWQRLLHQSGYRTGIAGKYLNEVPADQAPHFDEALAIERYDLPKDSRLVAQFASRFLASGEAEDDRPWALVLAPHAPHWPLTEQPEDPAPLPGFDPPVSESDLSDKHPAVNQAADLYARQGLPNLNPTLWEPRLRELQALDESVGIVFQALETFGEEEDTLAIYVSDNGFMWGEHGLFHKLWPYPESIRVPLFARWPGHTIPGTVDDRLAATIDFAPTIIRAAGLKPDYVLDGRSLFSRGTRDALLAELPDGFSNAATGEIPAWSALVAENRLRVEWDDGFIERYSPERDPELLEARNPLKRSKLLEALRACAGRTCRALDRSP